MLSEIQSITGKVITWLVIVALLQRLVTSTGVSAGVPAPGTTGTTTGVSTVGISIPTDGGLVTLPRKPTEQMSFILLYVVVIFISTLVTSV